MLCARQSSGREDCHSGARAFQTAARTEWPEPLEHSRANGQTEVCCGQECPRAARGGARFRGATRDSISRCALAAAGKNGNRSALHQPGHRCFGGTLALAALAALVLISTGCASTAKRAPTDRQFVFERDGFAYANELVWEYEPDPATGKMNTRPREPKPDYTHHCFVMARAARQFFDFAEFRATEPKVNESIYRQRVKEVIGRNPRSDPARRDPVVIPGYPNLRAFSREHEPLLKDLCGSAWESYFQRGHWRVVFPFSDRHQEAMVERLQRELSRGMAPVIHLVRFPQLTINHAVVVYEAAATDEGVRFLGYDPNDPTRPLVIYYRREDRRFYTSQNDYFIGGRVDVYEVYRNWLY